MDTTNLLLISVLGILNSVMAHGCALANANHKDDTLLLGLIPWSVVGALGYALIIATLSFPIITQILAVFVFLITLWLIIKAISKRIICPLCIATWVVNIVFVLVVLNGVLKKEQPAV